MFYPISLLSIHSENVSYNIILPHILPQIRWYHKTLKTVLFNTLPQEGMSLLVTIVPHASSNPQQMVPQFAICKTGITEPTSKGCQEDSLVNICKTFSTRPRKYWILNKWVLNQNNLLKRKNSGSKGMAIRMGVPVPFRGLSRKNFLFWGPQLGFLLSLSAAQAFCPLMLHASTTVAATSVSLRPKLNSQQVHKTVSARSISSWWALRRI